MKAEYWVGFLLIVLVIASFSLLFQNSETPTQDIVLFDVSSEEGELKQETNVAVAPVPYTEIVNPSGFVNTNDAPIKIADYIGKNLILVEVMTYSCINCQRTFPHLVQWYEKYKDDGLVIIGIHTPEFAFEKDKANVTEAMQKHNITFPVVMDNDFSTWRALGNRFWPRRYLIDWEGNVVFDHIGEGAYEENESLIKQYLHKRPAA